MEPGWEGEAGKGRKPNFCGKRIELSHREGGWEREGRGACAVQTRVGSGPRGCYDMSPQTILSILFRIFFLLLWALLKLP